MAGHGIFSVADFCQSQIFPQRFLHAFHISCRVQIQQTQFLQIGNMKCSHFFQNVPKGIHTRVAKSFRIRQRSDSQRIQHNYKYSFILTHITTSAYNSYIFKVRNFLCTFLYNTCTVIPFIICQTFFATVILSSDYQSENILLQFFQKPHLRLLIRKSGFCCILHHLTDLLIIDSIISLNKIQFLCQRSIADGAVIRINGN